MSNEVDGSKKFSIKEEAREAVRTYFSPVVGKGNKLPPFLLGSAIGLFAGVAAMLETSNTDLDKTRTQIGIKKDQPITEEDIQAIINSPKFDEAIQQMMNSPELQELVAKKLEAQPFVKKILEKQSQEESRQSNAATR